MVIFQFKKHFGLSVDEDDNTEFMRTLSTLNIYEVGILQDSLIESVILKLHFKLKSLITATQPVYQPHSC